MGLRWNQHKGERTKGVDTARGGRKGVEGRLPFSTSQASLSRLSLVVVPIVMGLYRLFLPPLSLPMAQPWSLLSQYSDAALSHMI